jgi:hypothetical protein
MERKREMRKRLACVFLAVAVLLLAGAGTSFAWDHGFRGHGGFHTRIFIGPGFWWGSPAWWGPPYPYYYSAPPVVVQQEPPTYVQQQPPEQPAYWHYCPNPAGYYPNVKECPPGWMTVVPQPTTPSTPPTR